MWAAWNILMEQVREKTPHFVPAVVEDAKVIISSQLGEPYRFRNRFDALFQVLKLAWQNDAFFALICYRAQARLDVLNVPVLPRIAHKLAMSTAQVCIGRTVIMHPGVVLGHGQVVIQGFTEIHPGVAIGPWASIGIRKGDFRGPTIERDVQVGTHTSLLGHFTVQRGATIAAGAVVLGDVPANATVAGVPAKVVSGGPA